MIIDTGKEGFDFSAQHVAWACTYDVTWQVLRCNMRMRDLTSAISAVAKARAYINGTGDRVEKLLRMFRVRNWIFRTRLDSVANAELRTFISDYRFEIDVDYGDARLEVLSVRNKYHRLSLEEITWDWNNVRKGLANLLDVDAVAWWRLKSLLGRDTHSTKARQEFNYYVMLYKEALTNYGRRISRDAGGD